MEVSGGGERCGNVVEVCGGGGRCGNVAEVSGGGGRCGNAVEVSGGGEMRSNAVDVSGGARWVSAGPIHSVHLFAKEQDLQSRGIAICSAMGGQRSLMNLYLLPQSNNSSPAMANKPS